VLLTTPESLALLASYPESADLFASVKRVVVDEIHAFAQGKRATCGADPGADSGSGARYGAGGLSATLADPAGFQRWLGPIRRWCWARRACPRMWM
jgi:ATP-dependent Lhr-like helicase